MSLLTPERVPVKVYRWNDVGAPVLDKSANCVANIFKACLVTGYGTKEGAGWTLPFGDTVTGVKVLRPEVGIHTDFYLRLSADTGTEMVTQVYLNMTDVNTGDLKLQNPYPFKYAKRLNSNKWLLIATSFGFWFFCNQVERGSPTKNGAFFGLHNVQGSDFKDAVMMLQSSTNSNTGFYPTITGVFDNQSLINTGVSSGLCVGMKSGDIGDIGIPFSVFNGAKKYADDDVFARILVDFKGTLYVLPGIFTSATGALHDNYDVISSALGDRGMRQLVAHATGSYVDNMFFMSTDYWEV